MRCPPLLYLNWNSEILCMIHKQNTRNLTCAMKNVCKLNKWLIERLNQTDQFEGIDTVD